MIGSRAATQQEAINWRERGTHLSFGAYAHRAQVLFYFIAARGPEPGGWSAIAHSACGSN